MISNALVGLSRRVNDGQVGIAIRAMQVALGGLDGVPVLVLGLTYREGVHELAYSRALPLIEPHRGWILAAMLLLSVVSSHAPSKLRYFVAIGKHRFKGAETKG